MKKEIKKQLINFYLNTTNIFPIKEKIKKFFPKRKINSIQDGKINSIQDGIRIIDRISAITMKQIADYHFGNYPIPNQWIIPPKINKEEALKINVDSKIIWIDTGYLKRFPFKYLSFINKRM